MTYVPMHYCKPVRLTWPAPMNPILSGRGDWLGDGGLNVSSSSDSAIGCETSPVVCHSCCRRYELSTAAVIGCYSAHIRPCWCLSLSCIKALHCARTARFCEASVPYSGSYVCNSLFCCETMSHTATALNECTYVLGVAVSVLRVADFSDFVSVHVL